MSQAVVSVNAAVLLPVLAPAIGAAVVLVVDVAAPHLRRTHYVVALASLAIGALATIAGAFAFYVFKRDRRYLRFIAQVVKYTIFLLLGILIVYAFERLVAAA